jgi:hypothetical protein
MSGFRLARVLRVRRLQEDLARNDVALARQRERDAVDERNRRVDAYVDGLAQQTASNLDEMLARRDHQERLAAHLRRSEVDVEQQRVVVATRLEDLARASRRVDGLERLEERHDSRVEVDARRVREADLIDRVGHKVGGPR